MYKDFHISVGTKRFITDRIKVERGVLQGDCLSPLLFNMCFNTLIQTIRQKKINCLGYVFDHTLQSHQWFQFADDTAIATSSCQDNQYPPNLFTNWAIWCTFQIFGGWQGRRTSHLPHPYHPLDFQGKISNFCHHTLLKIRFKITATPALSKMGKVKITVLQ